MSLHTLSLSLLSLSGADLSSLVREASIDALKEHMSLNPLHLAATSTSSTSSSSSQLPGSPAPTACPQSECVVCMRHFTSALKKIHPSVSVKVNRNDQLYPFSTLFWEFQNEPLVKKRGVCPVFTCPCGWARGDGPVFGEAEQWPVNLIIQLRCI